MKKETCEKENRFDLCPYVMAQRLLAGKWAILILQKLSGPPQRFNQLQKQIDVTQATLSSQLKHLEAEGLVCRKVFPEVPLRVEYSLTEIGKQFKPVLESIEKWGYQYIDFLRAKNKKGKPLGRRPAGQAEAPRASRS